MKKFYLILLAVVSLSAVSCNKNNDEPVLKNYDATVTFRPMADGKYYLRQDDTTALIVRNPELQKYPFAEGVEKRALINYYVNPKDPGTNHVDGYKCTWDVVLNYLDTILTKKPVVYDPAFEDKYGDDPIGLYLGENVFPPTMIEDGYLCVSFEYERSSRQIAHSINLLTNVDPSDPYLVEIRHNSNGDQPTGYANGLINFPLKSLPDTGGKTVKLTLRWNSLAKETYQTVTFDYRTRTDW